MASRNCKHCEGGCTKHYFDEQSGRWKRCPNVDITAFNPSLMNIPARYRDVQLQDFKDLQKNRVTALKDVQTILVRLRDKQLPKKSVIFSGPDEEYKLKLTSFMLRELVLMNISCSSVSLSSLTDLYFSNREQFNTYKDFDVLFIDFGMEIPTTALVPILYDLFFDRDRSSKYTMFTSKYAVKDFTLKYSKEMQQFFATEGFKEDLI